MYDHSAGVFSWCARDEPSWSELLASGCLFAASAGFVLVPGSTVHAKPSFGASCARGGVHGADFLVAFAAFPHSVFVALLGGALGVFERAYVAVSRALCGLTKRPLEGPRFRHFNLYIVRGLLI